MKTVKAWAVKYKDGDIVADSAWRKIDAEIYAPAIWGLEVIQVEIREIKKGKRK